MSALIASALRHRALVVILFVALLLSGGYCFTQLNIEAYPDPVPPLVDIVTQSPGLSAEEIERNITIPIEIQMAGVPNVKTIRTISLFGLSDVKVQFTYDFTFEEAQQRVINRLSQLSLPGGAQPQLSPASPIGEIYRYRISAPQGYSITDLKALQDWVLERRFKAVPGVIDVTGWGGRTKTFDVTVDMAKLVSYGLTLPQLIQALGAANINVGGQTVNIGSQSAVVRGVALIHGMEDIRHTMLSANNGAPVLLSDVATVTVGHLPRLGIAGADDDDDVVQGTVLMRRGEESQPTIRRVEEEVARINAGGMLPPGVSLQPVYDRSSLIGLTTHTVLHNMVMGILLIFCVQWAFLGDLRSALIVAATIPFALFFAIDIMVIRGESANLLSVGAIDFGLIVDATVIMMENIFRHLSGGLAPGAERARRISGARRLGLTGKFTRIYVAGHEVSQAIFFSAFIIIAGFVPLFTLSGIEGHIFQPMARTYAYALLGGLIATFTVTPALASILLPEQVHETETFIARTLHRLYRPAIRFALAHRLLTLGGAMILFLGAAFAARSLGLEFLPKLEEGNLWIRAALPPSISLEEGHDSINRMRRLIKSFPEVVTVISQHGRPDDGTDPSGFANSEFFVPLKPMAEWRKGVDKEKLTAEVGAALSAQHPGVEFNFSQSIQDNVEEAASGVKGENAIKVFGSDLAMLARTANRIKDVLATVPGVADLGVLSSLGQPTIRIDIDRERASRYGLSPGDVNATVQAAIGGQTAGDLYEEGSDRHFPIVVRLAPEYRENLDAIRNIAVGAAGPGGVTQVPLGEVASVKLATGASYIYRERQERYIPIKFSVRGRDLGGAVLEAQQKVAREVILPPGSHLEWVGEFGNLQDALDRLIVVVPVAFCLIAVLLYVNFGSPGDMLLAMSVIPMALIGGIFALYFTQTPFSVSAAIGFIALFGIAAMDGIIVLAFYNRLIDTGMDRAQAIRRTCDVQMRPVIMTCVAACVGLLPAAVSTGVGSQVQRPLALVVVGGITLAPALVLIVLPVAIDMFSRRSRQGAEERRREGAELKIAE